MEKKLVNFPATDLGSRPSPSEVIFESLRDAIIRGHLPEGETLRQDFIARQFNVSRIPVREALQRLQAQGLAVSTRYKGVVVTRMSLEEITEIFEFRALVEPEVIRFAVPRMTPAVIEAARDYCEQFSRETQPSRWGDLNRLFHEALYAASERPYYLSIISKTNDRIERYVRAQLEFAGGLEKAIGEHEEILAACAAGDADRAAELTRQHIADVCASLVDFMSRRLQR